MKFSNKFFVADLKIRIQKNLGKYTPNLIANLSKTIYDV
jgi:hypothetical protein